MRSLVIVAVAALLASCGSGGTSCSGDACCVCGGTAASGCGGTSAGVYAPGVYTNTCVSGSLAIEMIRLDLTTGLDAKATFSLNETEHTSDSATFSCTSKTTLSATVDSGDGCMDQITFDLTPMGATQVGMEMKLEHSCMGQGQLTCTASGPLLRM